jgi:4-nitrophenyl phosphatase
LPSEILVSGRAAALYLRRDYPAGTRVHVFGMAALRQALEEEGFVLADDDVEVAVVSLDHGAPTRRSNGPPVSSGEALA